MFGILRTVLALYVVLLHIFNIPTLGNYAVSFFFLLSGFLMTLIMHNTYYFDVKGFKLFWLNRILRLYPIYFVVLVLSIIVILCNTEIILNKAMFLSNSISNWFQNITMLYFDIVPHRIQPRMVPTSWALTNELVFYFLISLGISKTFKRTLVWLLISISYYVFTYLYYNLDTFRYSAIPASSLPFAMGAMVFWLQNYYANRIKRISNRSFILISLVSFLFFNLNAVYFSKMEVFKSFAIYINLLLSFLTIWSLYNLKGNKRILKFDNSVGAYSYPIYLSHYFVVFLYVLLLNFGIISGSFKLELKAMVPFMILLFVICYPLVLLDSKMNSIKSKLKR